MSNTTKTTLGLGLFLIALGCDGVFVLGDEVSATSSGGRAGDGGEGVGGATSTGGGGPANSGGTTSMGGEAGQADPSSATVGTSGSAGGSAGSTQGGGGTGGSSGVSGGMAGGGPDEVPLGTTLEPPACDPMSAPKLEWPLGIAAPGEPMGGVAGDFDRDGALDVATANVDGTVSVFFGQGDGTFSSSESYAADLATAEPYAWSYMLSADLDGSGTLDLVTTNAYQTRLSVLLDAGEADFAVGVTYDVGFQIAAAVDGDFDDDGSVDLAVGGWGDSLGFVSTLRGNGDGTFGSPVLVWTGNRTPTLGSGDFDSDGNLDLMVWSDLLFGDGLGGFDIEASTAFGHIVGDFNGDNALDLIAQMPCARGYDGGTTLHLGHGDGSFEEGFLLETGCPSPAVVRDANDDNLPDLVFGPAGALLSDGDGDFRSVRSPLTVGGSLVGLADFDEDGQLDAASAAYGWLVVRSGNGDGTFGAASLVELAAAPNALFVADLDGNYTFDIATNTEFLYGYGDGSFEARGESGVRGTDLLAADFDDDGNLDLATYDTYQGVNVFLASSPVAYEAPSYYSIGSDPWALAAGDVNGDAIVDLVASNGEPSYFKVFIGEGDGTFAALPEHSVPDYPVDVALADTNGDELLDVVLVNYQASTVSVHFGRGDGTFVDGPETPTAPLSSVPWRAVLGHLGGDKVLDLVVIETDGFSVYLGAGDGSFNLLVRDDRFISDAQMIDFDQDGNGDLVFSGNSLEILFGNREGSFDCRAVYALGGATQAFDIADLDTDGRLDVVALSYDAVAVFTNE